MDTRRRPSSTTTSTRNGTPHASVAVNTAGAPIGNRSTPSAASAASASSSAVCARLLLAIVRASERRDAVALNTITSRSVPSASCATLTTTAAIANPRGRRRSAIAPATSANSDGSAGTQNPAIAAMKATIPSVFRSSATCAIGGTSKGEIGGAAANRCASGGGRT